jgi:hypothetical protein
MLILSIMKNLFPDFNTRIYVTDLLITRLNHTKMYEICILLIINKIA